MNNLMNKIRLCVLALLFALQLNTGHALPPQNETNLESDLESKMRDERDVYRPESQDSSRQLSKEEQRILDSVLENNLQKLNQIQQHRTSSSSSSFSWYWVIRIGFLVVLIIGFIIRKASK